MPQRNDDGPAPPVKTLRKRLSGVYRADGFSGPTRRYVLIVVMLVGLASLPTLAAITAGSHELDDGSTGALDEPFLPPASPGSVPPFTPPPSAPAVDEGGVPGQAHRQRSKPDHSRYARSVPPGTDDPSRSRRRDSAAAPVEKSVAGPGRPTRPGQPARHHRPDRSRPKQCESTVDRRRTGRGTKWQPVSSVVRNRPDDRSETTWRANVAERRQNLRPIRTAERTHNSRRIHSEFRLTDARRANWPYRGGHHAERHHHTGDSRVNHRNTGLDRHHAEPTWHR